MRVAMLVGALMFSLVGWVSTRWGCSTRSARPTTRSGPGLRRPLPAAAQLAVGSASDRGSAARGRLALSDRSAVPSRAHVGGAAGVRLARRRAAVRRCLAFSSARRHYRRMPLFTMYVGGVAISNTIYGLHYTWETWMMHQVVTAALRFGVALELTYCIFGAFPAAAATARRVMFVILVATAVTAMSLATPDATYTRAPCGSDPSSGLGRRLDADRARGRSCSGTACPWLRCRAPS